MEKIVYEHMVIRIYNTLGDITKELDKYSIDGWELVCVAEEIHYLRRPKNYGENHINPKTGNYEIKQILGG